MAIFPKRIDLRRLPSSNTALDFTTTGVLKQTLTGNTTFASITGGSEGEVLQLFLQQDGTGSRTVTWPSAIVWIGGTAPTLVTAAWDLDVIEFRKLGSSYIGARVGNFHGDVTNAGESAAFAAEL